MSEPSSEVTSITLMHISDSVAMSSTMLISIQTAMKIAILLTSSSKAAVDDVQAWAERQIAELL